jgi:outer membrane protein assembly factor BamB
MKDFDDQPFNESDDIEIVDLDASSEGNHLSGTGTMAGHGQHLRLSPRTRIWLAFSTLVAALVLLVLILKPGLPSPAPQPAKPGKVSLSLPVSAKIAQVSSENGITLISTPDGMLYALRSSNGTQLWHFKAPTRVSVQVAAGTVYLVSVNQSGVYGFVMALGASNGTVLWGQSIPYPGPLAPILSDGTLYVSGHGGDVIYALRTRDGFLLWQYAANQRSDNSGPFTAIEAVGGFVYLLSEDNTLHVLRASDGRYLWSYRYQADETGFGLPAIEQGVVYIDDQHGAIKALRASDGKLLWQYHPGAGPLWPALVQDGAVYVSQKGGTMSALRASDGTLLHDYKNIGVITSQPFVQNGILYVNAADNSLEALRASDGAFLWRYLPPAFMLWPPQIIGNTVYVISPGGPNLMDKILTALQAKTGSLLWVYETGSLNYLLFRPSVTGNIAYISLDDTSMEALRLSDGSLLWYYKSPTPITLLTANNGLIFVSSQDGKVNALQASDGALLWHFP